MAAAPPDPPPPQWSNSDPNPPPGRAESDPRQALDDVPDFDIFPEPGKVKTSLHWQQAVNRTAIIGLSRQLHQLLHTFNPTVIGPKPGPYKSSLVTQVVTNYIVSHRARLTNPAQKGFCIARNVPEFRLIAGQDQFLFSDLASILRRHLVLLDIVD